MQNVTLRNSIMSQRKEIRGRARNAIYGDAAAITLSERNLFTALPVVSVRVDFLNSQSHRYEIQ